MTAATDSLPQRAAWKALAAHYRQIEGLHFRGLFANAPNRGERLAVEAVGIYLDYSKNRVTDETLDLLLQLTEEAGTARADRRDV
jgi:glucose-6-phosphate isomerase